MALSIFDYENYKDFVQAAISRRAKGGVGQLTALAKRMNVTPPVLSQVFRGARHLTSEQALETARFLLLSAAETEYFMALVEHHRAGTPGLKEYAYARAQRAKKIGHKVKTKLSHERQIRQIGPDEKAEFYSDWLYSAVRLATAIPGCQSTLKIAKKLAVPEKRVIEALKFLTDCGLCVFQNDGYHYGPQSTHIGADDPLVFRHHLNWRQKAIQKLGNHPNLGAEELSLTLPSAINKKSMEKIRKILLAALPEIAKEIDASESDGVVTLNIDFLKIY